MLWGNPALVVGLCAGGGGGGISGVGGGRLRRIGLLGLACFGRRLLAVREQLPHPRAVDEPARTAEERPQEQVQEDPRRRVSVAFACGAACCVHLRVEDRDRCFHDADCAVVGRDFAELARRMLDDGREQQAKVLRVQLRVDAVLQSVSFAGSDRNRTGADHAQVAHRGGIRSQRPQCAANEVYFDGFLFGILNGQERRVLLAIHKLDTKDFGGRECRINVDGRDSVFNVESLLAREESFFFWTGL